MTNSTHSRLEKPTFFAIDVDDDLHSLRVYPSLCNLGPKTPTVDRQVQVQRALGSVLKEYSVLSALPSSTEWHDPESLGHFQWNGKMHHGDSRIIHALFGPTLWQHHQGQEPTGSTRSTLPTTRTVPRNESQPGHHATFRLPGICVPRWQAEVDSKTHNRIFLGYTS